MKKLVPVILLGLLFISCTASKRISFLIEPEINPDRAERIDVEKYDSLYAGYDGVYLLVNNTIEHAAIVDRFMGFANKWTFCQIKEVEYVVLNPNNPILTTVSLARKPDKLYVHVTSPNGATRRFGIKDFVEQTDRNGKNSYLLALPDIVKGSVVRRAWEEAYAVSGRTPPFRYDLDLQYAIPCESLTVTFAYPDWWNLQVKKIGKDNVPAYTIEQDHDHRKNILSYSGTNIPAVVHEPYAPYFKEQAGYLEFKLVDVTLQGFTYHSPASWGEFAKELREHRLKKARKTREDLREKALALAADCLTPIEKVDAVVQYINDSINAWSGSYDGNYVKVMEEHRGNVYEITGLAQTLLEHLGFQTEYYLIHSATDGYFDASYISGSQMYAPALGVTIDSTNYVLFPYQKNLPINLIPERYQGQPAIVIDEPAVRQITIPAGNHAENMQSERYDLTIGEDGTVRVRETRTAQRATAYSLREKLADLREDELRDTLRSFLAYSSGDVVVDSLGVDNLEAYNEPLVITLLYRINNLVTITPKEILFQTGGFLSPVSEKKEKLDPGTRQNPIAIYGDQTYEKEITIRYPAIWQPSTILADTTIENSFGSITRHFSIETDAVRISQKLMLNRCFESRERMDDLARLISSKSLLDVPALVFKQRESGSAK